MQEIAKALVKAQKGFGPALKTSTNPHYKSRYADLAACVEAVVDSLNDSGIALIQSCHESTDGVTVETVFVHESGETLSTGKLHVPASKQDPQGYGSALTYARRYSLMAACGIAPEDDDGNAAAKSKSDGRKNGNLKPPKNVLYQKPYWFGDGVTVKEERIETLEHHTARAIKFCQEGKFTDAWLELENACQDNEEKLFTATFFDSTQRSALKTVGEEQRKKYADSQLGQQA
jgi:hypothetical protein